MRPRHRRPRCLAGDPPKGYQNQQDSPIDQVLSWVNTLPKVKQTTIKHDLIRLEGYLINAQKGTFRLLIPPVALELYLSDVAKIEEIRSTHVHDSAVSLHVRVAIRAGARLAGFYSSEPFESMLPVGQQSFATASRPSAPVTSAQEGYKQLEHSYLLLHGLTDDR